MKRILSLTGLLLAFFQGHAQEITTSRTLYVDRVRLVVMESLEPGNTKTLGYLRAGDSVQVETKQLSSGEAYVQVTHPDYTTAAAGSGWVPLKDLVFSRSDVVAGRTMTADELKNATTRPASSVNSYVPVTQQGRAASPIQNVRTTGTRKSEQTRSYYTGPRGGCYYYSSGGKKVYVDHSYCR